MAIYFSNKGHIDLDVIRTMGVSVKDTDNPIGYFGTGLKYAIATLLRTGHIVSLRTGGETIQFRTKPKEIRGKTFGMVYMDDEQLGFTIDLGRDWEVWQAYRELYANCIDEGGIIGGVLVENDTVFVVEGPEISKVHSERNQIFLHGEPWIVGEGIEVHRGKSNFLYYRGVRVQRLLKPTRFTYNFTTEMRLTEDRTLASVWDANYKLGMRLPRIANPEFCVKVMDPHVEFYEHDLDFSDCAEPSEEFLDAIEKFREHAQLKESNRTLLKRARNVNDYTEFSLSEAQAEIVGEACTMLQKLNCVVKPEALTFVEHLGPGVLAMAKDGKMVFTRQCLDNGRDFLAITIYEEWIHDTMGYSDCSRGMQQFLFDKILGLIKE